MILKTRSAGKIAGMRTHLFGRFLFWIIFKCDFGRLSHFAQLTTGEEDNGSVKYPQRLSGTLGANTEEIYNE